MKSGVYGRYRLTVRRDDEVIEQTPWFDNLIVNNGLDLLGTNSFDDCIVYAYVGTDSTAPANTDTSLGAQIAATNTTGPGEANTSNTGGSPYYFGYKYVKRFAKGDAAGNLTEVGVGTNSAGNDLFSHALILDGSGNPTTLTITSIDVLDVEYEFRVYVEEGDVSWAETVNGTPYSGVIRPSVIGNISDLNTVFVKPYNFIGIVGIFDGVLGDITSTPASVLGSVEDCSSLLPYSNGAFYRDIQIFFGTSEANFAGGFTAMKTARQFANTGWTETSGPAFQMSFSPAIPKDNTKTFEFTLRSSWARYTP